MEGTNLSTERMSDEGKGENLRGNGYKFASGSQYSASSLELYTALSANAGLEGVFDLAHFRDEVGGFD